MRHFSFLGPTPEEIMEMERKAKEEKVRICYKIRNLAMTSMPPNCSYGKKLGKERRETNMKQKRELLEPRGRLSGYASGRETEHLCNVSSMHNIFSS